jgi:O-antigen/teichoic acid export membrane protein
MVAVRGDDTSMRRLAGRSGWTIASTAVVTIAVFAETIVLARHFGVEQYGVLLLAIAIPEFILQILDFRIKDALTVYLSEALESGSHDVAVALLKLFWLIDVLVGVLALVLVLALANVAAEHLMQDPDAAELIRIYALGLVFSTLDGASGSVLRVLDRYPVAFFAGSVGIVVRVGLVLLAVSLFGSLESVTWARVAGEVALTLVMGTITLRLVWKLLHGQRHARISLLSDRRREIFRFLLSTNLTGLLKTASMKLDTILLAAFLSPSAVGLYRFALQFARAPVQLADALYAAVFPTVARGFATGRRSAVRRLLGQTSQMLGIGMVAVLAVGLAFGSDLLELAGGRQYADGAAAFNIALVGVAPYFVFFWLRPVLLSAGHPGVILRTSTGVVALQMVLIAVLVPLWGVEGAALAVSVAGVAGVAYQLHFVRSRKLLTAPDGV